MTQDRKFAGIFHQRLNRKKPVLKFVKNYDQIKNKNQK
jgi:hypothetical protein